MRRLIQIKDGHPENVELWLAFLKKHAYYGVGMKANVFEFAKLGMYIVFLAASNWELDKRNWWILYRTVRG